MNFTALLLEFLKNKGDASIVNFGTFYLNAINAQLDQEGKNILPPGNQIAFKPETNGNEAEFVQFIAEKKNLSLTAADLEIKKQVNYWNATLLKDKNVPVENLGYFVLEDSKMYFHGNRTEILSPDFYGLEQINISEIKNQPRKGGSSFQLSKSLYWLLPLVLILSALTYLGVRKPEAIFGKKSFETIQPVKESPVIIKDTLKIDSLAAASAVADSLKADSLTKSIVPVAAAPKKWTSKKSYQKSKWKKPRKRQNR